MIGKVKLLLCVWTQILLKIYKRIILLEKLCFYVVDHWREGVMFQGQSRVLCERKHLQRATPTLLHQEPTFQWVIKNKLVQKNERTIRYERFVLLLMVNPYRFVSTRMFPNLFYNNGFTVINNVIICTNTSTNEVINWPIYKRCGPHFVFIGLPPNSIRRLFIQIRTSTSH